MVIEKDVVEAILWASIEDYASIWEGLWEVNTIRPNNTEAQNREIAFKVITYLYQNDYLKFFYCQEPYGDIEEIKDVDFMKMSEILQQDEYWKPTNDQKSIRFSATEKGDSYYNEGKVEGLNVL